MIFLLSLVRSCLTVTLCHKSKKQELTGFWLASPGNFPQSALSSLGAEIQARRIDGSKGNDIFKVYRYKIRVGRETRLGKRELISFSGKNSLTPEIYRQKLPDR